MTPHPEAKPKSRPHTAIVRRRGEQRGAVAVELALILPILILLLAGIVGFGLAWNAQTTLQGAAREGARVLALGSGDPVAVTHEAAVGLNPNVTTSASPCTRGEPASVTATYDFSFNMVFFDFTRTLSATGVMRCERAGT